LVEYQAGTTQDSSNITELFTFEQMSGSSISSGGREGTVPTDKYWDNIICSEGGWHICCHALGRAGGVHRRVYIYIYIYIYIYLYICLYVQDSVRKT